MLLEDGDPCTHTLLSAPILPAEIATTSRRLFITARPFDVPTEIIAVLFLNRTHNCV